MNLRAVLLGAAALSSGVALTATSGWLIVRASERPVILTLLVAIVAVRAFGMARPVLRYAERLVSHDDALRRLVTARTRTYAGLVPLTPARLGTRGRGALLTAVVDDVTEVVEAGVRAWGPMASVALTGILTAAMTTAILPAAGMVVLALLVLAAVVTGLAWHLERDGQHDLGEARAEVATLSELVTTQAGALRAVGGGPSVLARLDRAQTKVERASRRQSRGRATAGATLLLLGGAAASAVAAAAYGQGVDPAVLAAVVLVPIALAEPFALLPEAARALARAQASERRLAEVLGQAPAVLDEAPTAGLLPVATTLELTDVAASWDGDRPALPAVTVRIAPGTRLAVTGPSGCGKSTLLAVLARQVHPTGSYAVSGTSVADLPVADVRALFALVDDEPHVFATSVRENLRLARPDATDTEVTHALDRAGLRTWRTALPDGLDTALGAGGRGISGGERARLAVARALLSGRPVWLLDEPLAHLDHGTARAVLEDLLAAAGDRTVVMVSHRPDGLERFDQVLDLTPGGADGTADAAGSEAAGASRSARVG